MSQRIVNTRRKYFDFFSGATASPGSPASRHRRHHGIAWISGITAFSPIYIYRGQTAAFFA